MKIAAHFRLAGHNKAIEKVIIISAKVHKPQINGVEFIVISKKNMLLL